MICGGTWGAGGEGVKNLGVGICDGASSTARSSVCIMTVDIENGGLNKLAPRSKSPLTCATHPGS